MDTSTQIHFTRAQLSKLHRQFFRPSASKLFNLLKKARLEEGDPETLKTLEDISKRCDPCQRAHRGDTCFRASFGAEDVRFNERMIMGIMYSEIIQSCTSSMKQPVSHQRDSCQTFQSLSRAIYRPS